MANANISIEVFNYRELSMQIILSTRVSVLCCDSGYECGNTERCFVARVCHAGFCFGSGCCELQLRRQSRCPESKAGPLPSMAPELSSALNS